MPRYQIDSDTKKYLQRNGGFAVEGESRYLPHRVGELHFL